MIYLSRLDRAEHQIYIVPEEHLSGANVKDGEFIDKVTGERINIDTVLPIHKNEPFPSGMLYLLTGKRITADQVWGKYKKSEWIFILCN